MIANVDKSVNQLRLVVAGKQADNSGCQNPDLRKVEVLMPGMNPDQDRWFPISPALKGYTPDDWDIRNNDYDDVLVVNNPLEGEWRFRTYYWTCPLHASYDFIMNVSVQSTIQLEGRLLGLDAGKAAAGDTVSILGLLLDKNGTLPAVGMAALIDGPGGSEMRLMYDDGNSGDGESDDGIYGAKFAETAYGGGYSVRIVAVFQDPANPSKNLVREWNGGFWIKGPKPAQECGGPNDQDKDCMPDEWERRCKLNLQADDSMADADNDGLTNIEELHYGTLPCRADTDKGGESDGSEVRNRRDPLNPRDDKVAAIGHVNVRPLNGQILIRWTRPFSYTNVLLYVSDNPGNLGQGTDAGQGNTKPGEFLLQGLQNDKTYYVVLQGVGLDEQGNTVYSDLSEPIAVTPKVDPDMPSGAMLIANDAPKTNSQQVVLNISATDTPLNGAAQGSAAHMTDQLSQQVNVASGNIQMRIANTDNMEGVPWQPVQPTVPWTLACANGQVCTVYAQFRDGAGNESLIVKDSIVFSISTNIFMPAVSK
jgi:hypothetical protein